MNSYVSDHLGDVLPFQNAIANKMGWSDNIQISYLAGLYTSDTRYSDLTPNADYSAGDAIDIARFGTTGNDVLDHSTRTTELRDLSFGFDGDDTIFGGLGNDFAYGGDDEDIIYGGDNNDVLYGGDDDDELYGGNDNDVIFGGSGQNIIDGGDGYDTMSLLGVSTGQTVTIDSIDFSASITV